MSDKNILSLLGGILLLIGLINAPNTAWAQCLIEECKDWTTVGSAGTVDEADTGRVAFNLATVALRPGAVGALNLRYNVVAVDGLSADAPCAELGVRYRDNGAAARVSVQLKRYDLETGRIDPPLLWFDSNDFPARDGFQLRTKFRCSTPSINLRFDFFRYAYFMDVVLSRTTTAVSPALAIIQLASVRR